MKKLALMTLALILTASLMLPAVAEVLHFGGLAPLTGNYAEYGKGFKYAWEKAIQEINDAGGVNGYTFDIDVRDSQGDAVVSSTLATEFAENDDIVVILGDFTSSCCLANTEIIDRYGITQLSPTCSSPLFCPGSTYNFSINGVTDVEAKFGAKYIVGEYMGAKSVGIIRVDSDWGLSTSENFMAQCEKEGIEVVAEEKYRSDEQDFSSIITKVKAANPEALMILDQGTAVSAICNACDSIGWDVPRVDIGASTSQQVADQLAQKGNLLTTSPFFLDQTNETLVKWQQEFEADLGWTPTCHPVYARDTVYLIRQAVEQIGDGKVDRQAIRDQLDGMTMDGYSGLIVFNEDGSITRRMYYICAVNDAGEWEIAETVHFDPADF